MKSRKVFVLKLIPFGFLGEVYKCPVLSSYYDISGGFWSLKYLRSDGVHNFIFFDNGSHPPLNLFYCIVSTERGNDSFICPFRRGAIRYIRSSWRVWRCVLRRLSVPDIDDPNDVPF